MNSIKGSFVLGKRLSCATFSKNFSAGDRCVNLLPAVSSCMLKNDFRTSSHSRSLVGEKLSSNQKPDWNRAVSEAEKIVGYPTSFLSLRWLLSDEIANVALHLRKLVGSNHPLLKTAKSLLYSGRNNMQAWGLIVLLISKAAGHLKVDEMEEDKAAGVLHSQRALAEVTEMIRTSHLVHKGLVNIYPGLYPDSIVLGDMMFGNKIALLGGDYLLGNCCAELAALRNQNLIEIMSSAIRDLTEGEFIGPRDMQNNPLPSRFPSLSSPISPHQLALSAAVKDWRQRNILSAASLLGNSCKGTLILAGHDAALQEHAYEFGKHLALASQMAKRPFREYSKRDMKNALLELKKNGSKLLSVSKKYKIPRSTLRRLRKKELLSPEKMGPPTLLTTQEEDILVAWLLELKDRGFPVNREQLIATVKNLLDKSERKVEKFVDNRPGQKWVDLFEKRHPEITLRTPQQLVKRRSDITKEDIENWFDETKDYLQKNNWFDVLSDPSRIFNCDEAAFLMNPKGNRVYAGKGDKTVYHVSGDDKECITVLFMISAADIQLPPMLVFKYERIPYDLTLKIPAHWAVGRSPETGWMTCCTFYEYISNVFYPWLIQNKVTLPVILFLDGHVSHMSPLLSEFCSDRGIILFAFVPNATHIQQPCDVSLFRPLKSIWKEEVRKWKDENEEFSLSKKDCAPILQKAFDRIEFSVIRNGFRTCGLYPFDKNAIDYKKLLKKNSEATSNTSEIVAETPSSFKKHLQFIEKRISPRKLQLYKCGEAGGDDSLYQFWQKLHDDATGSSFTSNSSTFLESSTNSFENSTSSDNLQLPSPSEIAAPLNLPFTESVVMSTPSADISGLSTSNSAPVVTSTPLADISGLNASNSTSVAVSTPLADIPGPSNSNNAPKNIPSPFKNLLPWPIVMKKKNGSKSTRNKEKLPYAVTSAEWQSYHKKKELEKEKLEKEKADRKDMRLQKKKEKEEKQKQSKGQKSKKKSKCTIVRSIESESEEDDPKWFSDPSDSESFSDEDINDTHHSHETKIEVGTYLLMKLKTEDNKEDVYYVAVVLAVNEKSLSVKYFRKTEKGSFKLPPIEDVGDVSYEKIEKILPAPIPGSTRRQKDIIKFNFDFATLNLR